MEHVNLHTHYGYKILQYLTFEISCRKWGGVCVCVCLAAHFWDNRKRPWLRCSTPKISCLFLSPPTYLLNIMVSILHENYLKSNHRNVLATYKSTLSQQVLSHVSPMAFEILWQAVSKVGCTSTINVIFIWILYIWLIEQAVVHQFNPHLMYNSTD